MGNRASSDFAFFLPTDCRDVMLDHAVKRVCVVCTASFFVALAVSLSA